MSDLLKPGYRPSVAPYAVESPAIPTGEAYYFRSGSGLRYQVLFARKKSNYLANIINFSVLDDAFENEYSETNRGELYRIVATVAEIIRISMSIIRSLLATSSAANSRRETKAGKPVSAPACISGWPGSCWLRAGS